MLQAGPAGWSEMGESSSIYIMVKQMQYLESFSFIRETGQTSTDD